MYMYVCMYVHEHKVVHWHDIIANIMHELVHQHYYATGKHNLYEYRMDGHETVITCLHRIWNVAYLAIIPIDICPCTYHCWKL